MATPYTVSRETTINAPLAEVRALITDFHAWVRWSPWESIDPTMDRTYSGAERGVGAHYAWEGNKEAGKGTMEITGVTDNRVDIALHFDKPFPSDNQIVFTLSEAAAGQTKVDWTMHGTLNTFMRIFSIFKSMDSMVGPDFEKGLRQLKAAAEG